MSRRYMQYLSAHSPTTAFICKTLLGLKILDEFYLGLDLDDHNLTCTIINDHYTPVYRNCINFDKDLRRNDNQTQDVALIWIQALDKLFTDIAESLHFDLGRVSVICGTTNCGLALWKTDAEVVLRNLDPSSSLPDQLKEQLQSVKKYVPKATNSSTPIEHLMEDEPRPSKKDIEELPSHVIEDIERISNPGSLLASLLIGRYADMEITSATMAGLWDMEKQCWDPTVADKVKHVNQKLGSPLTSYERVGNVSTYCAKRWRLSPKCTVVPFLHSRSADLVNLDLDEGDCVLRLDTQDTLSSYLPFSQSPQPSHCVTLDPRYSQPLGLTSRSLEIGAEIRKKACKGDWIKFGDSLRETQPGCLSNEKNAPRIPRFRFTRNQTENDKQSNKELIGTDLEDWCFEDGKKVKAFSPRPTEMPDQMDWKTINMSLEEFKEYKTDQYSIRALVDTEFLAIRGQLHYSASKDTPTLRILVIGTDPICKSGSFLQQLSNAVNLPVYMLTKPISFGVDDADTRCILAALLGRLQILRQPALEELEKPGPLELSVPVDMRDNPMWVEAIKKEKDARREKAITTYTKMLKDDKNINRQHALVAEPQQSQVQRYNQLYEDYKVCYKTMGKSE